MGLFDYVRCDHEMFGAARGSVHQTKDMDWPFMEKYEITPEGRLLYEITRTEDQSDKNAPEGSIESLRGCMAAIPTGEKVDMNYHGYLHLSCFGRCKFTDGQLVAFEPEVPQVAKEVNATIQ